MQNVHGVCVCVYLCSYFVCDLVFTNILASFIENLGSDPKWRIQCWRVRQNRSQVREDQPPGLNAAGRKHTRERERPWDESALFTRSSFLFPLRLQPESVSEVSLIQESHTSEWIPECNWFTQFEKWWERERGFTLNLSAALCSEVYLDRQLMESEVIGINLHGFQRLSGKVGHLAFEQKIIKKEIKYWNY